MAKRRDMASETYVEPTMDEPQEVRPPRYRPVNQLVDEFYAMLLSHPDVKVLTSAIGGKPRRGTEFDGVPMTKQHQAELRFIWKDTSAEHVAKTEPGPYEPGGRLYHMLPKKQEFVPEPVVDEAPKKSWEGQVVKHEKPEPVTT